MAVCPRFDYRPMKEGGVWIQPIPGDGNCLYGSLVHQLWKINPTDPQFLSSAFQMRSILVEFIKNNLPRYWDHLLPFAEDFIKLDGLDDYHAVQKYVALLGCNGTWGGEESISAACEVFAVNVIVWQESTGQSLTYYASEASDKTITMLYTGAHYDSVLWTSYAASTGAPNLLVSRGDAILSVTPFFGYPESLYKSFLHQLQISPDENALETLKNCYETICKFFMLLYLFSLS